jgi:hypothetical protein
MARVVAEVSEVRGRDDYLHHGSFSFVALPRVGDELWLVGEGGQSDVMTVVRCEHLPSPVNAASDLNSTVDAPSVALYVQFHHRDPNPD